MVWDADEENPPVGFEQDPESDDIGDGYWTYADGSKKYASGDPGDAKKLMSAAPPAPKEEPARPIGEQGPYSAFNRATPEAPTAPAARSPLGPSQEEEFLNAQTGAERDEERDAAAPPAPEASEQPKPLQALTAPRMPGAAGPARYTDSAGSSASQSASQSDQQSVQRTGSAQDRGEFEQGQRDIAGAYDASSGAIAQGSQGVADAVQQRRAAMMQMGADKEAAASAAIAQRDARANQVKQKIQEVGSRPTDHNKMWKDKGALGTTLGLLGVALRSLTATKFGGPNTAMQSIQEQRKQNLQAQMEDRDSELRGLERELGSLDAAVPIFEARMRDAENKRIEGMLLDEKSATVLANGQQMIAQNNTEKTKLLADGAKAYAGTIAKQQAQSSQLSQQQGVEQSRQRLSGAGVGGEGAKPLSAQDVLKERLAGRDLKSLEGTELTHDEFTKELTDYRDKAGKQNEFRSSLDALSRELGVTVTRNEDGTVTVSGEPDVDLLPSEKKRKIEAAFARLKRADVMSMTREPSADLQDEFGGLTDRPFWDSEITPKLQSFYGMQRQLQQDLDGGYNPSVVRRYRAKNDVGNKPSAKPVTGRVTIP